MSRTLEEEQLTRLDLNLAPFLNESAVNRALGSSRAEDFAMYPEVDLPRLRTALSNRLGVPPEALIIGCGSDELIDLAMRTLVPTGGSIGVLAPSFGIYDHAARACGLRVGRVPVQADLPVDALASLRADAYFLPSPNNPTGAAFPRSVFEDLLDRTAAPVIIDEAYAEFARQDLRPLARQRDNVLVLRTFSKAYGLPGIRIGYGLGRPPLVDRLRSVKMPYNVSSFSERVALAALEDSVFVEKVVSAVEAERSRVFRKLQTSGWPVWPSVANFHFVGPISNGAHVRDALRERGIAVKLVDWPGGREGSSLRIGIGTLAQDDRLLEALEKVAP